MCRRASEGHALRKLYSLLFCVLLFAFGAHADDYPQPALESYGALPFVSDSELSPDGTKVALIAHVDGGTRFVVFDLAAGGVRHKFDLGALIARGVDFVANDRGSSCRLGVTSLRSH